MILIFGLKVENYLGSLQKAESREEFGRRLFASSICIYLYFKAHAPIFWGIKWPIMICSTCQKLGPGADVYRSSFAHLISFLSCALFLSDITRPRKYLPDRIRPSSPLLSTHSLFSAFCPSSNVTSLLMTKLIFDESHIKQIYLMGL